jgi:hypothetical protein
VIERQGLVGTGIIVCEYVGVLRCKNRNPRVWMGGITNAKLFNSLPARFKSLIWCFCYILSSHGETRRLSQGKVKKQLILKQHLDKIWRGDVMRSFKRRDEFAR